VSQRPSRIAAEDFDQGTEENWKLIGPFVVRAEFLQVADVMPPHRHIKVQIKELPAGVETSVFDSGSD
jgi:hypothetical protein